VLKFMIRRARFEAMAGRLRPGLIDIQRQLLSMKCKATVNPTFIVLCAFLMPLGQALAQDLEPRRWTPLPSGLNVIGVGYVRTQGDVFFDPVLQIEDAEVDGHTVVLSYVHSFLVGKKLARFDMLLPWQNMRWTGLLDGAPATASRVGLADPWVRLSVILAGAPASGGSQDHSAKSNTVIGAAIAAQIPLGEYLDDRLLNLGQNRVVIRPQIGVLHTRGKWSYELTGSVFFYGNNDDFFGGSKLEKDPLYAVQAHIIRVFDKPGYWLALSAGYGRGGQATVDGIAKDNSKRLFLSALAFGVPVRKNQGVKFAYIRQRTNTSNDADTDSLAIAWSVLF